MQLCVMATNTVQLHCYMVNHPTIFKLQYCSLFTDYLSNDQNQARHFFSDTCLTCAAQPHYDLTVNKKEHLVVNVTISVNEYNTEPNNLHVFAVHIIHIQQYHTRAHQCAITIHMAMNQQVTPMNFAERQKSLH